jgi:hypothetical protein
MLAGHRNDGGGICCCPPVFDDVGDALGVLRWLWPFLAGPALRARRAVSCLSHCCPCAVLCTPPSSPVLSSSLLPCRHACLLFTLPLCDSRHPPPSFFRAPSASLCRSELICSTAIDSAPVLQGRSTASFSIELSCFCFLLFSLSVLPLPPVCSLSR